MKLFQVFLQSQFFFGSTGVCSKVVGLVSMSLTFFVFSKTNVTNLRFLVSRNRADLESSPP